MKVSRSWVVTEGYQGNENQALGLAEALGIEPEIKRIRPRAPWARLPPRIWPNPLQALDASGDLLSPPWPDLVISAGKRAAAPVAAMRQAARSEGQPCFAVHLLRPPIDPRRFDVVVVPRHDHVKGDNMIVTTAAVHRVTPEKLRAAAQTFEPIYKDVPRPRVAVLVGGSNNRYQLTAEVTRDLAARLVDLATNHGAGLLVTTSRRTGAENETILRTALAGHAASIWDGTGDNPYLGFLGLADYIVVTCDSVSMASEACSTGKPVYVVDLEGASKRIGALHDYLRTAGLTRPFTGDLETWSYPPLNDTAEAAREIRRRLEN